MKLEDLEHIVRASAALLDEQGLLDPDQRDFVIGSSARRPSGVAPGWGSAAGEPLPRGGDPGRAVRARRLRVPEDLSIVGMVSEPMAEMASPPLTTVSFPADEMGRTGARLLLDRMGGMDPAAEHVFVKPELTVRGSSAPPRLRGEGAVRRNPQNPSLLTGRHEP